MRRTLLLLPLLAPLGCRGEFDLQQYVVAEAESKSETSWESESETSSESESESETSPESESETSPESESESGTDGRCANERVELADGCFGERQTLDALIQPTDLALADFSGFGHVDLLVAGSETGLYLGSQSGQFLQPGLSVDAVGTALAVGEVSNPGDLELPDFAAIGAALTMLRSASGGGQFEDSGQLIGGGRAARFADLDGDGVDDLVIAGPMLYVWNNLGDGLWAPTTHAFDSSGLALADLDSDGRPDLVLAAEGKVWVLVNNGSGGFDMSPGWSRDLPNVVDVALVDVDGDGRPEIVAVADKLYVFGVTANFVIIDYAVHEVGDGPRRVAIGDVDGDHVDDVVVINHDGGDVSILRGNKHSLEDELRVPKWMLGGMPDSLALADLDGDGRDELVVGMSGVARVVVLGFVDR